MAKCSDFVDYLGPDMALNILMYLDEPSDLIRVSAVSRSWRHFVIRNGLCKKLCLKMFPVLSRVTIAIEISDKIEDVEIGSNNPCLDSDHRLYAFLAKGLTSFMRKECIFDAISASSTDNYPDEGIQNTLALSDRVEERPSYWSSKGESNPAVPETLTYKLISKLCIVTEVGIEPFEAYFQYDFPIYSAKAVRFRFGHPKSPLEMEDMEQFETGQLSADNFFVWSYVSPEFPMAQENCLQKFKLPEPVLCIGGILQIELLGRVQRQEMDGLFYICVSDVQVMGRPLSPSFDVEFIDVSGKCILTYKPEAEYCMSPKSSDESNASSELQSARGWERIMKNRYLDFIEGALDIDLDDLE